MASTRCKLLVNEKVLANSVYGDGREWQNSKVPSEGTGRKGGDKVFLYECEGLLPKGLSVLLKETKSGH